MRLVGGASRGGLRDGARQQAGRQPSRRGTYDRRLSPSERVRAQRADLLLAVRQVLAAGEVPSVSSIAAARGLGRNTFYEHFSTVEMAIEACVHDCAEMLEAAVSASIAMDGVATPSEQARRLSGALSAFVTEQPEAWAVLSDRGQERLTALLERESERMHRIYMGAGAGRVAWSRLAKAATSGALVGLLTAARRGEHSELEIVDEMVATLGRLLR